MKLEVRRDVMVAGVVVHGSLKQVIPQVMYQYIARKK